MNTREKYKMLLDFVIQHSDRPDKWGNTDDFSLGRDEHQDDVADDACALLKKLGINTSAGLITMTAGAVLETTSVPTESAEEVVDLHLMFLGRVEES